MMTDWISQRPNNMKIFLNEIITTLRQKGKSKSENSKKL